MKKLISVALALVMVFAMAVSVGAKSSPSAKAYYAVTVATNPADGSLGTASVIQDGADKGAECTVTKGTDGEVTLKAVAGDGYFTLWLIEGKYDVVTGDEKALELVIKPKSDIRAVANFRKEENFLNMTVATRGSGSASVDPASVGIDSGDLVTFTAVDGAEVFTGWDLGESKYDIVEGSLKSRKLVVRPYTDIHAVASFGSSGSNSSTGGSANTGSTSPKTGDPLFLIIGLAVLAFGTGAFAVKKIKE